MINIYHYGILFFNLLPIYPLDGGKLTQLILSLFLPYKKSLQTSILISYIVILIYIIVNITSIKINGVIISIFLIHKVYIEQNKVCFIYEKFLLERYLNNYKFKQSKIIVDEKSFYKNKRHLIRKENKYLLEKEYLTQKYNFF